MNDLEDLWKEAAARITRNAEARVLCPECGTHVLKISDRLWTDGSQIERELHCQGCGARHHVNIPVTSRR